jgi:hypothetical protein
MEVLEAQSQKINKLIQEKKQDYRLMISSAFYESKSFAPQFPCLLDAFKFLEEIGVPYNYQQLCGDSYVCRAKNSLVHSFLKSNFTHLMILDSDHTWSLDGFIRLVRASILGAEIVAGLYPCKNNWEFYGGLPRLDEEGMFFGKEYGDIKLLEMTIIPGGFVIYSREAFERTRPILDEYWMPETDEYVLEAFKVNLEIKGFKRKSLEELEQLDKEELLKYLVMVNPGGRKGAGRIGEDVYFSTRYRQMGGIIWCEPNINMGHIGVKEWTGNYMNHLKKSRGMAA